MLGCACSDWGTSHKLVTFSLKPISDFRGVANGTAYVHAGADSCPTQKSKSWNYWESALQPKAGWADAGEDLAVKCIGRHGVINYNK